jgi:hypothetical protein
VALKLVAKITEFRIGARPVMVAAVVIGVKVATEEQI